MESIVMDKHESKLYYIVLYIYRYARKLVVRMSGRNWRGSTVVSV